MRIPQRRFRSNASINQSIVVATLVAFILVGYASRALAYNGTEHIRFPDQAYQVMNIMRRGSFYADQAKRLNPAGTYAPLVTRPPTIPASMDASWQAFVAQALAAPAKLDNVFVDLSNPPRPSQECGGVFASLPNGALFGQCRAGDLGFAPRRGWAENSNDCYLREGYQFGSAGNDAVPVVPFFQGLQTNYTGALLGMWATRPDDETSDTTVFLRPTNIGIIGDFKDLAEAGEQDSLEAVLVPLFCLGDLVFGGNSCFDDAINASKSIDPIARVDDSILLPVEEAFSPVLDSLGQALLFGASNPGSLWHFMLPKASPGRFNSIPGLHLATTTLGISVDSVDVALTAYFDFAGITMNPSKSTGIGRYDQFRDGQQRDNSDWASFSIAHVEFDPVSYLGEYGWQQFLQTGTARGLGWIDHAIGDALCPMHDIGTLGWGHQPWERFADIRWVSQLVFPEADVTVQYQNMVTELTYAFQYWTLANQSPQNNWVGPLIKQLATDTLNEPFAVQGRAFQGTISFEWATHIADSDSDATDAYDGEQLSLKDLMMRGVGASIALLAKASISAPAPPATGADPCACTTAGQARSGEDLNGRVVPNPGGGCVTCGTGVFQQEPDWLDGRCVATCPPDKPTVQGGICTGTQACPPSTPFVKNGSCVAACCPFDPTCPSATPVRENGICVTLANCSTPIVVSDRVCATACPAGQVPDPTTLYCGLPPSSPSPSCSGVSPDSSGVCCVPEFGLCSKDVDCCSKSCRSDGVCRGVKGDSCLFPNDCISGSCYDVGTQTSCGGQKGENCQCPGSAGETCQQNVECVVACTSAKKCCALDLQPCTVDPDCCSGLVCTGGICVIKPINPPG